MGADVRRRGKWPAALALKGFDCVVDTTGVPAVVEAALSYFVPAGKLLVLASCPTQASISIRPRLIEPPDATVYGSIEFSFEFESALELLQQGRIQADPIVTHRHTIEKRQEAFCRALSAEDTDKVCTEPHLSAEAGWSESKRGLKR